MTETRRCSQCGAELPAGMPDPACPACLMQLGLAASAGRQEVSPQAAETSAHKPAAGFDAPSVEHLTQSFAQLEVLELIGKGGMGAVYKARQTAAAAC